MANVSVTETNNKPKLSHKQWKALMRKERKKAIRQKLAQERDRLLEQEEQQKEESPTYLRNKLFEERLEKLKAEEDEKQRGLEHEQWCLREKQAQELWRLKKEAEAREKQRRADEEKRIREEWEEKQRKEAEEAELRKEREEKRKAKQDELLKQATANRSKSDGPWHNPLAPTSGENRQEVCPFFAKVAACRFAERCSRAHPDPGITNTLLFPGMFARFELEQGFRDEYDTDLWLEFDDTEVNNHFREFYADVLPEFKKIGRVIQFKVCCNYEKHLRGNVYVQFEREDEAHQAMVAFNSRWYAGRQISCQFADIPSWKSAICGLFFSKKCQKGKSCNFLHVFRNPNNEFRDADMQRDFMSTTERRYRGRRSRSPPNTPRTYSRSDRHHKHHRRSRSRSPATSRASERRRSRSRDRVLRRSRDRSRLRDRDSRRSRSRERYSRRSRDRDSRSRSRERYSQMSKDRDLRSSSRGRDSRRSRDRDSRSRSRERYSRRSRDRDSRSRSRERYSCRSRDRDSRRSRNRDSRRSRSRHRDSKRSRERESQWSSSWDRRSRERNHLKKHKSRSSSRDITPEKYQRSGSLDEGRKSSRSSSKSPSHDGKKPSRNYRSRSKSPLGRLSRSRSNSRSSSATRSKTRSPSEKGPVLDMMKLPEEHSSKQMEVISDNPVASLAAQIDTIPQEVFCSSVPPGSSQVEALTPSILRSSASQPLGIEDIQNISLPNVSYMLSPSVNLPKQTAPIFESKLDDIPCKNLSETSEPAPENGSPTMHVAPADVEDEEVDTGMGEVRKHKAKKRKKSRSPSHKSKHKKKHKKKHKHKSRAVEPEDP